MLTKRHFSALLASAAVAIALGAHPVAAAESAPSEFRIGFQKASVSIVARQQQSIEKRLKALGVTNVKWVEFQFGPPMLEALGSGSIDIGAVGDTPPIFAQAAGANVTYVAVSPAAKHAILVPETSPLRTVADLKGKKVAIPRGSSAHNVVVQALAANGLSFADITPVYLSPADATAAFARGAVDAFAIWDPFYALVELKQKGRPLTGTEKLPPTNSFYLANKDFAKAHPDVIKATVDEIGKITAWAGENRAAVAEATSAATGLDPQANTRAIDRADFQLGPLTPAVVAQQQAIADAFFELGLIPRKITVKDAVWVAPQS